MKVDQIAIIEAVIDVEDDGKTIVKWQNVQRPKKELEKLAKQKFEEFRPKDDPWRNPPMRVFLLGKPYPTDFQKDSPGGMQSSKQYFDVEKFKVKGAEELAKALAGKTWSEFRG